MEFIPFIYWEHLDWFLVLAIMNKAAITLIFKFRVDIIFNLFGLILRSMISESYGKKLPNCLPKWLYYFAFPLGLNECFCCSISLLVLDVDCVLYFCHPNRYVVVSLYCFNFYSVVTYDVEHLFICFFAIYVSSLCILDNSPLSEMSFANIFS